MNSHYRLIYSKRIMSVSVGHRSLTPCISFLFGIFCLAQLFESSEAAIQHGICGLSEYGRTTTEKTFDCRGDEIVCSTIQKTCSCEGQEIKVSGSTTYKGTLQWAVGAGGWDCTNECWGRAGSSGGQSTFTSTACHAPPSNLCSKNEDPSK